MEVHVMCLHVMCLHLDAWPSIQRMHTPAASLCMHILATVLLLILQIPFKAKPVPKTITEEKFKFMQVSVQVLVHAGAEPRPVTFPATASQCISSSMKLEKVLVAAGAAGQSSQKLSNA